MLGYTKHGFIICLYACTFELKLNAQLSLSYALMMELKMARKLKNKYESQKKRENCQLAPGAYTTSRLLCFMVDQRFSHLNTKYYANRKYNF